MAKYRVTLSSYQYHTVDVEANSPDEAEKIVNDRLREDEYSLANEYNTYDEGTYVVEGEAIEEYITYKQMETIKEKCKELINNGTSLIYIIGCIYGLYEDYIISEEQETELYKFVDPQDEYNEPSNYWQAIDGDNELAKCIGY